MNSAELHFQLMKLFASILPVGGVASFDAQIMLAVRIGEEFFESNASIKLLGVAETDFVLIFVGDEDGLILLESELVQFGLEGALVLDWILQTNLQENDLRIHKRWNLNLIIYKSMSNIQAQSETATVEATQS